MKRAWLAILLATLTVWATPSFAAFAFVQQAEGPGNTTASTTAASGSISVTAGNLLVCFARWTSADVVVTVAGGANSLTQIGSNIAFSGERWALFYKENTSAVSGAITATFASSSSNPGIYCGEYSGIATSSSLISGTNNSASVPGGSGSGTDVLSISSTITSQPALFVGLGSTEAADITDIATGTGATSRGTGWAFGSTARARLEDKRITSTGSNSIAWTGVFGSQSKVGVAVAFAEASGAVTNAGRASLLGVGR